MSTQFERLVVHPDTLRNYGYSRNDTERAAAAAQIISEFKENGVEDSDRIVATEPRVKKHIEKVISQLEQLSAVPIKSIELAEEGRASRMGAHLRVELEDPSINQVYVHVATSRKALEKFLDMMQTKYKLASRREVFSRLESEGIIALVADDQEATHSVFSEAFLLMLSHLEEEETN